MTTEKQQLMPCRVPKIAYPFVMQGGMCEENKSGLATLSKEFS